jgi:hypothetical protein
VRIPKEIRLVLSNTTEMLSRYNELLYLYYFVGQKAKASLMKSSLSIGQAGGNDYSKWKYTLTPAYVGTIKEGVNRIIAKLVCQASPVNLTKFYSINVTGMNGIIPKQPSAIASNNTAALPVSSNSMSYLYHLAPLVNQLPAGHNHTISTSTSSSTSSDSSGDSGHHHHNTGKNHVKSRTSRHGIYEGGGFFNGGPSGLYDFIWNFGLCAIRIIFDQ